MANPKIVEQRKTILRARGVPEKFVAALATRRGGRGGLILLFQIVPLIAFLSSFVLFHRAFDGWLYNRLYPEARQSLLFMGADTTQAVVMAALMTWVAGFVLLALWSARRPVRPWPAPSPAATRLRTLSPGETVDTLLRDDRYAALDALPDDTAFLGALPKAKAVKPRQENRWAIGFTIVYGVVMVGLLGFAPLIALTHYTVVRGDTVEVHYGQRTRILPLSAVRAVHIACHDNSGSRPRVDYWLDYGARGIELWEDSDPLHGFDTRQVAAQLAQIDAHLAQRRVPIVRAPATGGLADDAEDCVNDIAKTWPAADRAQFHHLVFGS